MVWIVYKAAPAAEKSEVLVIKTLGKLIHQFYKFTVLLEKGQRAGLWKWMKYFCITSYSLQHRSSRVTHTRYCIHNWSIWIIQGSTSTSGYKNIFTLLLWAGFPPLLAWQGKTSSRSFPLWGTSQTLSMELGPPQGRLLSHSHPTRPALAGHQCSPIFNFCFSVD